MRVRDKSNQIVRQGLKIFISVIMTFYGLAPALAELKDTHLFHPLLSEHTCLLSVWLLAFLSSVAVRALYIDCKRHDVLRPTGFGVMFVAVFWIATLCRSDFDRALTGYNGIEPRLLGTDATLLIFSTVTALLFMGFFSAICPERSKGPAYE